MLPTLAGQICVHSIKVSCFKVVLLVLKVALGHKRKRKNISK